MDLQTQELLRKKRISKNIYQRPHINFNNYCFTSRQLRRKRTLWKLVHFVILSDQDIKITLFYLVKKIITFFNIKYDKVIKAIIQVLDLLYFNYPEKRQEILKLLEDLAKKCQNSKDISISLSLTKLKYYYLAKLDQKTQEEDISYLNNMLFQKEFIDNQKFHFLVLRFQASIDKYFYKHQISQTPIKINEYLQKTKDIRFYRVFIKKLISEKDFFKALFFIQNLLLQFKGFDECYYYVKTCLKICDQQDIELPDILIKHIKLYYMNSKKVCHHLINIYKKQNDKETFKKLLQKITINLLAQTRGTEKIWKFYFQHFIRQQQGQDIFLIISQENFFQFHVKKIIKKINNKDFKKLNLISIHVLEKQNQMYIKNESYKILLETLKNKIKKSESNQIYLSILNYQIVDKKSN